MTKRILTVVALGLFLWASSVRCQRDENSNIVMQLFDFLQRGGRDLDLENMDEKVKLLEEYDFIVVGAGTAGCALAARLSENPNWKVLLLEAGGPETLVMDMPIIAQFLQLTSINWGYKAQASKRYCQAMNNHRCSLPRGKVMGGSSVLNYMMYTRCNRRDYDRWAELGNEGWTWEEVLPYFKKYEGSSIPDAEPDMVGRDGPVKISYSDWRSDIAAAFIQASVEAGLKKRDYNGHVQTGVNYLQATVRNATRWSSNRAYLYPLKGRRKNLHIRKHATVTKVLIHHKSKVAYGVAFVWDGKPYKIMARQEVILSAGAINTPQLLMLSGVGPAEHLQEKGIEVLADLSVGFNLQDHFAPAMTFTTNASSMHLDELVNMENFNNFTHGHGKYGLPGGVEAISFWGLDSPDVEDSWPDMEIFQCASGLHTNPAIMRAMNLQRSMYWRIFEDLEVRDPNTFTLLPMLLRPKSRGRIILRNADPFKYPLIYMNYLDDPYDVDIVVRGLQKAYSLTEYPAFKAINAQFVRRTFPACDQLEFNTPDFWECYARHFTMTIYHYSGTAKMGPATDPTAVVDARLRVYGIANLRVVDGSIMPELVAGHPNGPIFMIAEKAADMIKQDHNYI